MPNASQSNMDLEIQSATSQIQGLSVTDTAKGNPSTNQPRANFPLPPELRTQILAYLLHHEHTHDRPYKYRVQSERGKQSEATHRNQSTAHTYRFHPAILAVNRAIHGEASEFLGSNNFVVVSHQRDRISSLKHQHDLAIVTENQSHVARFRQHKLRVHFRHPILNSANQKVESFLMVSKELPNLCKFLQWSLLMIPSPSYFITHLRGTEQHQFSLETDPEANDLTGVPGIKLQVHGQLAQRTEESLLKPFGDVMFGMLNVKVLNHGAIMQDYARKLEQKMGPRTIWSNAMAWRVLETVRTIKHDADNLLCNGEMVAASKRYRNISTIYDLCPIFHFEDSVYNSQIAQPFALLAGLMITAAIMETITAIRLQMLACIGISVESDALRFRCCLLVWFRSAHCTSYSFTQPCCASSGNMRFD